MIKASEDGLIELANVLRTNAVSDNEAEKLLADLPKTESCAQSSAGGMQILTERTGALANDVSTDTTDGLRLLQWFILACSGNKMVDTKYTFIPLNETEDPAASKLILEFIYEDTDKDILDTRLNDVANALDDLVSRHMLPYMQLPRKAGSAEMSHPEFRTWLYQGVADWCKDAGSIYYLTAGAQLTTGGKKLAKALRSANVLFAKKKTQAAATTSTATSQPKQPGQGPANNYKASGGHIKDVPNTPTGKKETLTGKVYCVIADKIGKNTPSAYITPVSSIGKTVSKADAMKLKFGSANGYTDCTLWFESQNDADVLKFLCLNLFSVKYQNFRIFEATADPNGYLKVDIDGGLTAYVKASKLNESFEEESGEELFQRWLTEDSNYLYNKKRPLTEEEITKLESRTPEECQRDLEAMKSFLESRDDIGPNAWVK